MQLAMLNGYTHGNSLTPALRWLYPLAEALIAETIGLPAQKIWPTLDGSDGKANRGERERKPMLPARAKPSRLRKARNPRSVLEHPAFDVEPPPGPGFRVRSAGECAGPHPENSGSTCVGRHLSVDAARKGGRASPCASVCGEEVV